MRLSSTKQEAILNQLDTAIDTLKNARRHVYEGGVFRPELWDTALVQLCVGLATQDMGGIAKRLGHPGEGERIQEEGFSLAFGEPTHFEPNRGTVDDAAAEELHLYLTNDGSLYGPNSMGAMIERRYEKLWKKGLFDEAKAVKGYMYLVDEAAKRYVKDHGSPGDKWHEMFNKPTRQRVAEELTEEFITEAKVGNFRG